jgi:hypothetical protein
LDQLRNALRSRQPATFTFKADELNALIARHPDFVPRKGQMRFAIADSVATVDLSVPLRSLQFSGTKHRWLNGRASFGFVYAQEGFALDARSLEANGHQISPWLVSWTARLLNRSVAAAFERAVKSGGDQRPGFWDNVKTMTLDGDQLVVITRGE